MFKLDDNHTRPTEEEYIFIQLNAFSIFTIFSNIFLLNRSMFNGLIHSFPMGLRELIFDYLLDPRQKDN